ncbi:hypothetical protein ICL81_04470 [Leucobacter sp. cx-328]|uniref:hypothetical protein n=1 Tax=unclassified Leucobacter TaxID=2621730 RepID=UPI00165E2F4F|nr:MULTISPECIES: hypothetical protein [unclassified Leucobacter]MBC9943781.1 hypothetical protein [Leucobacter sp. cx-328]
MTYFGVNPGPEPAPAPTPPAPSATLSWIALGLGLGSVGLFAVFFGWADSGMGMLLTAMVVSVAAVVVGIIALVKRQRRDVALIGLIVGALVLLVTAGLLLFALLFVGALLGAHP